MYLATFSFVIYQLFILFLNTCGINGAVRKHRFEQLGSFRRRLLNV